ncbi:MAG: hypothetical protein EOM91_01015 [Sphingobacteriia bacterium]|nr:hypothetical protein [Sphingobacteriia bacterium]NCC40703.1 hypothetical protein [Gammaproteobacteria bacterium]
MIQIRHQVSGRVRLKIPAVAGDPALALTLTTQLEGHAAIQQVRLNQSCASLVVHFDPQRLDAQALVARIQGLLQPSHLTAPSPSVPVAPRQRTPKRAKVPPGRRVTPMTYGLSWPWSEPAQTPMPVCRLNARLVNWMMRTSLNYWWHDLVKERPRPGQQRLDGPGRGRRKTLATPSTLAPRPVRTPAWRTRLAELWRARPWAAEARPSDQRHQHRRSGRDCQNPKTEGGLSHWRIASLWTGYRHSLPA